MPPSESALIRRVLTELNTWPCTRAVKIHGSIYGRVGDPDIWGCTHGKMFVLEAKRPGYLPRVSQMMELRRWRRGGAVAEWFNCFDQAIEIVRKMLPENTSTETNLLDIGE